MRCRNILRDFNRLSGMSKSLPSAECIYLAGFKAVARPACFRAGRRLTQDSSCGAAAEPSPIGLKRAAILLGTIMVLSSGVALAQDRLTKADLVQLVVTLGVYDNRCEKLAPRLLADLQRMVRMLDKGEVMAGVINEQEKVDRAGEAKWCDAFRPVVEKYKDGLLEPVR